jgi:choline dehydrogenase
MLESYDYIIVGAGSAGCALAYRLSQDPSTSVLLLEAGGKDSHPMIHIPLGFAFLMKNPSTNWCYETEPEPHLNHRKLPWPRGKVLGGSSSINGMVYIRGQARDYDEWEQLGNEGWSYRDVLPYFKKSEAYSEGESGEHGVNGPLWVDKITNKFEMAKLFIEAGVESGIHASQDFNRGDNEGIGFYDLNIKNGRRYSSAKAFLSRCKSKPNIHILTRAQTLKLLLSDGAVTGVEYLHKGKVKQAHSNKEVVLCSGTVNTPQLLELSGIGNKKVLDNVGIDTVVDLPGVGENLQDHLTVHVQQKLVGVSTFYQETRPLAMLKNIVKYFMFRTGLLNHPSAQAGAFFRSDENSVSADAQIHFAPAAGEYNKRGNMVTVPGTTATVCYLKPQSRGSIHITSKDPLAPPKIIANYLDNAHDCKKMVEAFKKTRQIFQASVLDAYRGEETQPGAGVTTDQQILDYIREAAESVYHPVGTCKMGCDDMAVVDNHLRVRGVAKLRIADCSIMPTIPSGNTHAAAVMIAEKCADYLLGSK